MNKRNKIIYWIATLWLASGLLAGGVQQLAGSKNFVAIFEQLQLPLYLMYLLGTWKILGTIAILVPGAKLVKEWAYAGSFFMWSGALCCHIAMHHGTADIFPSIVLLILTGASWYFRPAGRRFIALTGDRQSR